MSIRIALACLSAGLNACLGGAIFCFPLLSDAFATQLHLNQSQLSTIAIAGVAGQYPLSLLVGKILDKFGPRTCSLAAALLFSFAFGLSSWELHISDGSYNYGAFLRLVMAFLIAGIATVLSYFSAVFGASIVLSHAQGAAFGVFMSLFGLSPLFLSLFRRCFLKQDNEIDAEAFTLFLAIILGLSHLLGAFLLPSHRRSTQEAKTIESTDSDSYTDERTSLLSTRSATASPIQASYSLKEVLQDSSFWLLAVFCFLVLGACEMVMSNIGTIAQSLPPFSSASSAAAIQVRILSGSNTISRLLVGPLMDWLSYRSIRRSNTGHSVSHFLTYSSALLIAASLLAMGSFYMAIGLATTKMTLWPLCVCVGITYGVTFPTLPVLVGKLYGQQDIGRNFGLLAMSIFLGSPVFSFIYATISERNRDESQGGLCQGMRCWNATFYVVLITTLVSVLCTVKLSWKLGKSGNRN